jgi:hypothetical protein
VQFDHTEQNRPLHRITYYAEDDGNFATRSSNRSSQSKMAAGPALAARTEGTTSAIGGEQSAVNESIGSSSGRWVRRE